MALIKKPTTAKVQKQMRIRLDVGVANEISNYCNWAELPSIEYFLEQAAIIALRKDKEWKKIKADFSSQESQNLVTES